jgi:hypothetical protein
MSFWMMFAAATLAKAVWTLGTIAVRMRRANKEQA